LRYKIDLKSYMADCEANYYRLCRLLPGLHTDDLFAIGLPSYGEVVIRVTERTAYTWLLEICQGESPEVHAWLQMPHVKVRCYRDARLAEVVTFEGNLRVYPRNEYPNHQMYHPDEKAQWNHFLSEWLAMAIQFGYATRVPCEFGEL